MANDQQHIRDDLLRRSRESHAQLEALLAPLSDADLTRPGVTDDWSVKDHLAHITWWEQRIIRGLRDNAPDLLETLPNVDPTDTDAINAAVFAANHNHPLAEVRSAFAVSYQEMLTLIETLPDDVFTERYDWLDGNAASHYDEHIQMFRAWLARKSNT